MTWAFRRRLIYIAILIVFFGGLGFWIGYPHFNQPPTCTDGKRNGDETGVDCGGSCQLACTAETDDLKVLWSRSFEVVPGRYNAVAYIENKNKTAALNSIKYRFRFADENNVYVGKREGQISVPTAGKYAIFEPAVDLGSSVPVYTSFEFLEEPIWVQVPEERIKQAKVAVSNIELTNEYSSPILEAKLTNTSLFTLPRVDVIAILYDEDGNALSASRTYFDKMGPEAYVDATFTWPQPMSDKIVSKEIIPMWNMFNMQVK